MTPVLFTWPVGGTTEADRAGTEVPGGWYIATDFDREYTVNDRRAVHPGLDLSDARGGDADLGAPVYAAADGVVVESLYSPQSWGNLVLIRHDDVPGYGTLWSQYGHLAERKVKAGDRVTQGQQIGTVGKGAGDRFAAHLHFELRKADRPAVYWPGNHHDLVRSQYVDPLELLGRRRP